MKNEEKKDSKKQKAYKIFKFWFKVLKSEKLLKDPLHELEILKALRIIKPKK